jgi:RHS repeat-associated protein
MKNIIYITLCLPILGLAQSYDQNFIKTITYKVPSANEITTPSKEEVDIHVNYADGLGRPCQQLDWQQSSDGKSLYTHIEYDGFGRQKFGFLPYPGRDDFGFDTGAKLNTTEYYGNYVDATSNPYSEKFFDYSPLNRVLKQAAPGDPWVGIDGDDSDHTVKFVYGTNNDEPGDDDDVRLFKVILDGSFQPQLDLAAGRYGAGQLYKTTTRDENWTSGDNHSSIEFKDKEGHVILKRTFNGSDRYDTYYVYDDFGNLTYVIPPAAVNDMPAALTGLCYQYRYDRRNRIVAKRLPGKSWEYVIYDKLDRPVLTGPVYTPFGGSQTGWMVTKYDAFGRVAYTAWKAGGDFERQAIDLQVNLDGASDVWESHSGSNVDNIVNVYSSNVYPQSGYRLLTINYYDDYDFPGHPDTVPSSLFGWPVVQAPKGLSTGSWVRVLTGPDDTNGETSYLIYDTKGRVLKSHVTNHMEGFTDILTNYNFAGQPVYTEVRHLRKPGADALTTRENFTYTAQGRLLSHTHRVNDLDEELISYDVYDELGQLEQKRVGGADVTDYTGLQTVDYSYNIRGWLKTINDARHLNEDLFAFRIAYNDPDDSGTPMLFNGNISETYWQSSSDNIRRKYSYHYDGLNRLLAAHYAKPDATVNTGNSYDENLEYDMNGNIARLWRNGELDDPNVEVVIDELIYAYSEHSNQLMKATDMTNDPAGFKDDSDGTNDTDDDYTYDDMGNMLSDNNKNIIGITYNHLNLPAQIRIGDAIITYIYDATGKKVLKIVPNEDPMVQGSEIKTDYLDGFQYENARLKFFPHSEGYVNVFDKGIGEAKDFNYVYNYLDHLGNIRLSYALDPRDHVLKIIEENHYYPFGLKHRNYNMTRRDFDRDEEEVLRLRQVTQQTPLAYKYKYNGKEFQDELGLNMYDYGARNYDPAIGRWMNIDPLADKYYNISPYVYVADSPILHLDPDGKEIIVANKKDQGAVLKMINSKALGTFAFNKSGKLYLANAGGDSTKFSKYYQTQLVAAINAKEKINISIGQTYHDKGVTKDVDKDAGGGVTLKNTYASGKKDADVVISGNANTNLQDVNGNALTDNPADILAHELVGHAIPHITKPDTGNAVDNENKVRTDQNTPARKKEPTHNE